MATLSSCSSADADPWTTDVDNAGYAPSGEHRTVWVCNAPAAACGRRCSVAMDGRDVPIGCVLRMKGYDGWGFRRRSP